MTVTFAIEIIGPNEARRLLAGNTHNRVIRDQRVKTYASDMRQKAWVLNGETIKVSVDGRVLDGQHRLLAVIESGCFVSFAVVRGLEAVAQETIDKGMLRSLADTLHLEGIKDSNNMAAIARLGWLLTNNRSPFVGVSIPYPSHTDCRRWLDGCLDAAQQSVSFVRPVSRDLRFPISGAATLHLLMSQISPEQADYFWEGLGIGAAMEEGDPVLALRGLLIRDLTNSRRMDAIPRIAITIKAWNKRRAGEKAVILAWRRGQSGEPFPAIDGLPGKKS